MNWPGRPRRSPGPGAQPVDERDAALTLLRIHDLHVGPIGLLAGGPNRQHHPVIADRSGASRRPTWSGCRNWTPTGRGSPSDPRGALSGDPGGRPVPPLYRWSAEEADGRDLTRLPGTGGRSRRGLRRPGRDCQLGGGRGQGRSPPTIGTRWDGATDSSPHGAPPEDGRRPRPASARAQPPAGRLPRPAAARDHAGYQPLAAAGVDRALGLIELQAGPRLSGRGAAPPDRSADRGTAVLRGARPGGSQHGRAWLDRVVAPVVAEYPSRLAHRPGRPMALDGGRAVPRGRGEAAGRRRDDATGRTGRSRSGNPWPGRSIDESAPFAMSTEERTAPPPGPESGHRTGRSRPTGRVDPRAPTGRGRSVPPAARRRGVVPTRGQRRLDGGRRGHRPAVGAGDIRRTEHPACGDLVPCLARSAHRGPAPGGVRGRCGTGGRGGRRTDPAATAPGRDRRQPDPDGPGDRAGSGPLRIVDPDLGMVQSDGWHRATARGRGGVETMGEFLTDVATLRERARAQMATGIGDRCLRRRSGAGGRGAESGAGHRTGVRPALQAALLHRPGGQRPGRRRRVPPARHRGAGSRRHDRRQDHPVAGRARLRPRHAHAVGAMPSTTHPTIWGAMLRRGPGRRACGHRLLQRGHRLARCRATRRPGACWRRSSPSRRSMPRTSSPCWTVWVPRSARRHDDPQGAGIGPPPAPDRWPGGSVLSGRRPDCGGRLARDRRGR